MHIDFYWLYEIPSWLFALLIVAFFVAYGLVGLRPTRKLARYLHRVQHAHNDIVSYYLGAITVLYGITLGLVAVGTWTTHEEAQTRVSQEAQVLGSLYRDVDAYPNPIRGQLTQDLRNYTKDIIQVDWPEQRRGVISNRANGILETFQHHLLAFGPESPREQILHAEAYKQFNQLAEMRRARLDSIRAGLPSSLWVVVIIGALLALSTTWFFDTPSFRLHLWMTTVLSALLGLMIYVVASLDNPFRGSEGITPGPLHLVYTQTMGGEDQ